MTSPGPAAAPEAAHDLVERELGSCFELCFRISQAPPSVIESTAWLLAPDRWLLVDAAPAQVAAAVAAGGLATDVTGKWRGYSLRGTHASAALRSGVNLDAVLDGRAVAVVSLFDCPVVIGRSASRDGFEVCVHASYAASLRHALERALRRAASP